MPHWTDSVFVRTLSCIISGVSRISSRGHQLSYYSLRPSYRPDYACCPSVRPTARLSVPHGLLYQQESRAVARKRRDAAAVLFDLKFADNIHSKFKSSEASKARLQSSKHTGAKQNLTQKNPFKVIKGHVF